jgi:hypothetical protein
LRRLQRNASQPDSSAPSPREASPRRRWTRAARILAPLVVVALLLLAGAQYVRQSVDVERVVRQQIIPRLEEQIGTRIEVGRVESDYISRVTLHDVVIGRDKRSPLGALFQVKSAVLDLDIISLALKRSDALTALRRVVLNSPQVVLQRDARGALNWAKLFKRGPKIRKCSGWATL